MPRRRNDFARGRPPADSQRINRSEPNLILIELRKGFMIAAGLFPLASIPVTDQLSSLWLLSEKAKAAHRRCLKTFFTRNLCTLVPPMPKGWSIQGGCPW
jgi:hypothetical protein